MKRQGNLWEKIISYDNLYLALKNASRGKKRKAGVKKVLRNPDKAVHKLHDILVSGFKNSKYRHKIVYEPKQRLIYILPFFPDRIVHHAVINVVENIWDNLFISDSYSCRKDKGQHAGSERCMDFVRRYKYCLKCDISKFYPSINHDILKQILRKKIKDEKLLSLLDTIIERARSQIASAEGWLKHANSYNFKNTLQLDKLKELL